MASTLERIRETLTAPERRVLGNPLGEVHAALAAPAVPRRGAHARWALAAADALAVAVALLSIPLLGDDGIRIGALALVVAVPLVAELGGLYDRDELVLHRATLDEAPELFQLASATVLLVSLAAGALVQGSLAPLQLGVLWIALFLALGLLRWAARAAVRSLERPERCLCIGDPDAAARLEETLSRGHRTKAEVVATVPLGPDAGAREPLRAIVAAHAVDRVVVAPAQGDDEEAMLELVRAAKALGVRVSILPRIIEVVGSSVRFDQLDGITMLGVRRFGLTRSAERVKRGVDLLGVALLLLACAPLLAAIALAIRLDTPGPVLFRQTRVGRGGRPFTILKFRTMVADAERRKQDLHALSELDGLFKLARDPRVTRVGRLLRQSSLDELPQLFNVLRGEMSLVGPRPLILDEDCQITGWSRGRLYLKPGMTGPWQVLGSGRISLQEMVKIDHRYVAGWSLWLDLKILARTALHVLGRRGL